MTLDVYRGRKTTMQQQQQQMKFERIAMATYDVTFMLDIASDFFRRHFGTEVFI